MIVVQHRHTHSKCHRPYQAVGQCPDCLARLSARAIQARCGFVACQSFDWQVLTARQQATKLLLVVVVVVVVVVIVITSAGLDLHDHNVCRVHRGVVLE